MQTELLEPCITVVTYHPGHKHCSGTQILFWGLIKRQRMLRIEFQLGCLFSIKLTFST